MRPYYELPHIILCFLCLLWLVSRLVSDAFLDQQRDPRCADELAAVVGDINFPDAHCASSVQRLGLDGDNAFADGTQMIGVDLDSDGRYLVEIRPGDDTDRCGRFSQINRNAAIHNAGVLMNLRRNRHRQNNALGLSYLDLNAEKLEQLIVRDRF